MHLQVQTHILCIPGINDVFVSLTEELRRASDVYVTNMADTSLAKIKTLLHQDMKIPTVIDEAQRILVSFFKRQEGVLSYKAFPSGGDCTLEHIPYRLLQRSIHCYGYRPFLEPYSRENQLFAC